MGRPKALLPIEGETFIGRIVASLKRTQVGKILVVLGHNADQLAAAIGALPVEILINPNYQLGQLSSLQVAVRNLLPDPDCDGMEDFRAMRIGNCEALHDDSSGVSWFRPPAPAGGSGSGDSRLQPAFALRHRCNEL